MRLDDLDQRPGGQDLLGALDNNVVTIGVFLIGVVLRVRVENPGAVGGGEIPGERIPVPVAAGSLGGGGVGSAAVAPFLQVWAGPVVVFVLVGLGRLSSTPAAEGG